MPGRACPLLDRPRKRIVATGVDDDQAQALGLADGVGEPLQRNGFAVGIAVVLELGIHRDQIVGAADPDAEPGIVHDGNIGVGDGILELSDGAFELQIAGVVLRIDDVKPGLLQHCGDGVCIFRRIAQGRHMLIGGIANHQRNTALRKCSVVAK